MKERKQKAAVQHFPSSLRYKIWMTGERLYSVRRTLHRSRAHSSGFIHTQSLHRLNWLVYALGVEAGNKGGLKEKQKTAATGHGVL